MSVKTYLPCGLLSLLALAPAAAPVLASVPALGHAAGDDEIPFEDLVAALLADSGQEDAHPDTFDVEAFLERAFVRTRWGLFEVYMLAPSATERANARSYQNLLLALLDAQSVWLDWVEPVTGDLGQARKDIKKLRSWARSARPGTIVKAAERGGGDLFTALEARPDVVQAAQRFALAMGSGEALGLEREDLREPLILAPSRLDFMQLIAFAGWVRPDLKDIFWQPSVAEWTSFYVDEYKTVALQLAAPGRPSGDYTSGVGLDFDVPNGVEQQTVQHAMNSLCDNYFGAKIPPALAGGLAVNLVIDLYGECNTRVDGDLRERRTEAYETFVPGGLSQGGVLPKNSAQSRWRAEQGADHFVRVLRAAQRDGASKSKKKDGKIQHFELQNDGKNERIVIHGPYLGAAAADQADPPADFYGDHLEFLRAYRTCFVHWLRTSAGGSEAKSGARFAAALADMASGDGASDRLEEVFQGAYAVALSSKDLSSDTLEGAYLRWLARQK